MGRKRHLKLGRRLRCTWSGSDCKKKKITTSDTNRSPVFQHLHDWPHAIHKFTNQSYGIVV